MLTWNRRVIVTTPAQLIGGKLGIAESSCPHNRAIGAVRCMAIFTQSALLEILGAAATFVVGAILDPEFAGMARRTNLTTLSRLAHEWLGLPKRAFRIIQVGTVAGTAIHPAIVVHWELWRTIEHGKHHVIGRDHTNAVPVIPAVSPSLARIHDESVMAGKAHGFAAGDILLAAWQLRKLFDGHDRVGAPALEITNLRRMTGGAVKCIGCLFRSRN